MEIKREQNPILHLRLNRFLKDTQIACGRISDAVLDAYEEQEARVACETFATTIELLWEAKSRVLLIKIF